MQTISANLPHCGRQNKAVSGKTEETQDARLGNKRVLPDQPAVANPEVANAGLLEGEQLKCSLV